MSLAYNIIRDLYFSNRNFCSEDYDKAVAHIADILPCNVLTFEGPEPCNGWQIPPKWELEEAWIKKDGKVIYDGSDHPLKVICVSNSFQGTVDLKELKRHLHHKTYFWPDGSAIPFHFRQNYQPWNRDWGFNVPRDFYDSLEEGEYEVCISAREEEGYLRVIESHVQGESDGTFVFVAHLDHPGMANDDLAGCAVGIELFKRLHERPNPPKHSYKLLLVQEMTGTEYYLGSSSQEEKDRYLGGLFLEMLGTDTPLVMHHTRGKSNVLEQALQKVLDQKVPNHTVLDYGKGVANDEIVFESHGLPMASLNRFPYNAYHTHYDNLDIIDQAALDQSLAVAEALITELEADIIVEKNFSGLVCLSNPEYDLYVDLGQTGEHATDEQWALRRLMDGIGYVQGRTTVGMLAREYGVDFEAVATYLRKWEAKGLLTLN